MSENTLLLECINPIAYKLSTDMQYILDSYGNYPTNKHFYDVAKSVSDCIGHLPVMNDPWSKEHTILPWQLSGLLSIHSIIPSTTLCYTAGISFAIFRYTLQTYC